MIKQLCDTIMSFYLASEIQAEMAVKARNRRRFLKYSRQKASELSGVPVPTIRKFEDTGEISLRQFFMLLQAYGDLSAIRGAFDTAPASTMDELIQLARREKK